MRLGLSKYQKKKKGHVMLLTWAYTLLPYSRNLPVYIKQIGFKKVRVDNDVRKEVSLMKNIRHSKLTEFVGLILEPQHTLIVEGIVS